MLTLPPFPPRNPHRATWREARTLTDVGALTARWLTGDLPYHPAYRPLDGVTGPDPETTQTPGVIDALVALNRAGFVTWSSQPGFDGPGHDGATWRQRPYVLGFAHHDTAWRLWEALHPVEDNDPRWTFLQSRAAGRGHHAQPNGVCVSTRDGKPHTTVDVGVSCREVDREFTGLHWEARAVLTEVWQVLIVGTEFGSNELWPALRKAAESLTPSVQVTT